VWSGEISAGNYLQTAFNWWIGDAVALSSLTPFLLEFFIPWCRRHLGFAGAKESSLAAKNWGWSRVEILESFGFLTALAFLIYLAFGNSFARSAHLFYLFFLPLIGIAICRFDAGALLAPNPSSR
jgi:integral membrane sensor domain MASE1